MTNAKNKVIKNSFLYTFSSILVKAVGFLLLPLYTHFLTVEDYGIINLVTSFLNIGVLIVAFSLYRANIRFYNDYKDNKDELKKYYSSLINFIFLNGIMFFLIFFLLKDLISKLLFDNIDFFPIIFIALISLIFLSMHELYSSFLRANQEGKKLVTLNFILFSLTVTLKIIFIVIFRMGPTGFLLAQSIAYILYFLYMMIDLYSQKLYTFSLIDLKILTKLLKYSIPLIPHDTSTYIASFFSRMFLNKHTTLKEVGLYSVGMQFSSIIDLIQVSFNKAFQPWFFGMMKKGDKFSKRDIVNFSSILLLFYTITYMIIGLFSQEVILLLTPSKYALSWTVIPILVLAYSVKSIYYFFLNVVLYSENASKKLFIATITGSLADIIIAVILIPYLGMYGSAIAFVIAKVIVVIIIVVLSKKHLDIGYSVLKMLSIIIPSIIFMGVGLFFSYSLYETSFSFINLAYKFMVFILYMLFVYFANKKKIHSFFKSDNFKRFKDKLMKKQV